MSEYMTQSAPFPDEVTAPDFTDNELWLILWALRDKYWTQAELLASCERHPELARYSDGYEQRMARISAAVAKFPTALRKAWATSVAEIEAEVAAA